MRSPAPGVKICGMVRLEDARAAARAGADRIGVIHVPGTPRFRTAEEARALGEAAGLPLVLVVAADLLVVPPRTLPAAAPAAVPLPADASAFAAPSTPSLAGPAEAAPADPRREAIWADALLDLAIRSGAAVLQLHGEETPALVERLRSRAAHAGYPLELWKALRVRPGERILPSAHRWAGIVDLLLLDGWHPHQHGGTGTPFPWEALEEVRAQWPPALGLGAAGGLRPSTVGEAVQRLRPDWVDVSSGVEYRAGEKNAEALAAFVAAARAASDRCRPVPGELGPGPEGREPPATSAFPE